MAKSTIIFPFAAVTLYAVIHNCTVEIVMPALPADPQPGKKHFQIKGVIGKKKEVTDVIN